MSQTFQFTLPYEPNYTGHRVHGERRRSVKTWLRSREVQLHYDVSPPLAPEMDDTKQEVHAWSVSRVL